MTLYSAFFPVTRNLSPVTFFLTPETWHLSFPVGEHAENLRLVCGREFHRFGQSPLALAGFGRQDVTSKRMVTHDLAATRDLEPLGSSLVGLELEFAFRDLSQIYPPEDSCDPAGLAEADSGALGLTGDDGGGPGLVAGGRGEAPPVLPAAFFGARMAVRFGPSRRGRASTCPASPTSWIKRSIISKPKLRCAI